MADVDNPTPIERIEQQLLAAAIVESARDNRKMPLPGLKALVYTSTSVDPDARGLAFECVDVEDFVLKLAREITSLVAERGSVLKPPLYDYASSSIQQADSRWEEHVAAYPREEFLAAFRDAHTTLHRLWTAAVGKEGYDKAAWRAIDNALSRFARDAAETVGISRSEPLL